MNNNLPTISIIIPAYNSEKTLMDCLDSIVKQDYPKNKLEIITIDGGSSDTTLEICKEYNVDKILTNSFRIEEKGRAIGIDNAKNEILGFIDADNVLPNRNFLKRIIEPFSDPRIVGSEPLFYDSREKDNVFTKYVSLIGGDDPIAIYFGNYDRFCYFKNKWTDAPVNIRKETKKYIVVNLDEKIIPPMGANGFFARKNILRQISYNPFLHTDIIYKLIKAGYNDFAKVKIGIIHLQGGIKPFVLKKKRRVHRLLRGELPRKYSFKRSKVKILRYTLYSMMIFPLFIDVFAGIRKNPNRVWFIHIIICPIIALVYILEIVKWQLRKRGF